VLQTYVFPERCQLTNDAVLNLGHSLLEMMRYSHGMGTRDVWKLLLVRKGRLRTVEGERGGDALPLIALSLTT
jgi:hypothetical protein